ncbi:transporter [Ganoderma sinense ZZ0214-1]|uniref:Transporter n=1 Tax=Ganoderma sinense ZZ0214-1 TaxID=1077348 RepID=A0A2G8RQY8_9APHY|nr:transporter [Ganoderma sinense ZZ0214-1]
MSTTVTFFPAATSVIPGPFGGSLDQNPPTADRHITNGGTDWAWTVFAVMFVSDFVAIAWTFIRPRGTRLFHQIAVIVLTTATIAYFSMGSDLGATPIPPEFNRDGNTTRQIWYVRYIQYFITFPLLLLELLLATGVSFSDIFTTLFMGWVVVVTGLVGALVRSSYKWGYFAFGILALFYVWYSLLINAPRSTFAVGGTMRGRYWAGAAYFSFLLFLYPIAWAICEGSNNISPTGEFIWYGILDILAGPVFLFLFLASLRAVDYTGFGLMSTKYSETMPHEGGPAMRDTSGPASGGPEPVLEPAAASQAP